MTFLAWERVAAMDAVRADEDLAEQARDQRAEARRNLDTALRRAYQHVLYLGEGDGDEHARVERIVTFEDSESALDGTAVWKMLAAKGKAFGTANPLDAKALLHNLQDGDYGRPLDEVRDLFWSTPRMPLLAGGDTDLQQAIFQALEAGSLRLVGAGDLDRAVARPGDIGVGQSGLRLAKPKTAESTTGGTDFLRSLTNAVDEGKVSYTQIMLKVVIDSSAVEGITDEARQAGANPTVRDI